MRLSFFVFAYHCAARTVCVLEGFNDGVCGWREGSMGEWWRTNAHSRFAVFCPPDARHVSRE